MARKKYNPKDWYWIVGGDETQVFSSLRGNYFPVADATYVAWKADGTKPSRTPDNAELAHILSVHGVQPVNATVLDLYRDRLATKMDLKVVGKVLFNIVNEIRVLKGQSTINAAQFKSYVKGLM
jgi:hypothetical protein